MSISNLQVELKVMIYRHGDRSIVNESYYQDKWSNSSFWPMGYGQLTDNGVDQQYELGKWLRTRYCDFLPVKYSPNDIYVRSTDVDRTIVSALSNLSGMYPPVQRSDNQTDYHSQIVPVHTESIHQDKLFALNSCPRFAEELEKLKKESEVQMYFEKYDEIFKYINNKTRLTLDKNNILYTMDVYNLYDIFFIESLYNYTLPKWTKKIYPEPLRTIIIKKETFATYNAVLKKLRLGPLLQEVVTHMNKKINGTLDPSRKLWIYSAHDFTIVNVLNSLNVFNNQTVPYASLLMLELRQNSRKNYVVTVSYRNSTRNEPYLLQVPGCSTKACDLRTFEAILAPFVSTDRDLECLPEHENDFFEVWIYLTTFILIAVVLAIISFIASDKIVICFRKRTEYITL
ncbi:prostatic acid phosphatase-like isoform X2 [Daktulosphaira vitifoliae]|uniref:prostatic acid phosphatase-like isoform X2 n=2 Tax=Daktulosphaira vitifoliae TaxID=58002 RepID=UPI0021AA5916|nr:prostatic acid phosphatase-like isoform X2 [Daktulosphaira vitifoliae]